MTQISKYPVSKAVYEKVFDVFLKTVSGLHTKDSVSEFFKEFLTPTEQIMLAKRLAIAFLLEKGYDYREISRILRVSTTTVSRVSVSYKYGSSFQKVVKKLLRDEKIEKFWLNVGEKVAAMLASPKSKSGTWIYLKQELEKKRRSKSF